MEKHFPILGYDVGGTKIAVSLMISNGKILSSQRFDNRDTDPDEVLAILAECGKVMIENAGLKPIEVRGIGISTPGPADIPNGIMTAPPNNPKWRNVRIGEYLSKSLGMPAVMENDANAGMLAEWFFGAGKGCRDAVYLTMSTGIGGGIIAAGHLVDGTDYYAGEVGHTVIDINGPMCNCGLRGCYEAFCGGRAVAQRLQRELADQPNHAIVKAAGGKLEDVDFVALEKAVIGKDPYAMAIWDEVMMRNAQGVGIIINSLNPEKIILGTIPSASGDLFMKPFLKYLPRFCWQVSLDGCDITTSALGRKLGDYAGPAVVLNELYEKGQFDPFAK